MITLKSTRVVRYLRTMGSVFLTFTFAFACHSYTKAESSYKHASDPVFSFQDNPQNIKDVLRYAEKMPQFPGGEKALVEYIAQNLRYPSSAKESGKQGRVLCSFIISKEGKVLEPYIVRSVHPELDAEAIRVIRSMPDWEPGRQLGLNVNVKYTIPIYFNLMGKKH